MSSPSTSAFVTNGVASAIEMLLKTGKYSDLTIVCRRYSFNVHRNIVCTRSQPFAAAVDGNFKESITREINLDEDEPIIVDKLIEFLYTGDFDSVAAEVRYAASPGMNIFELSSSMGRVEPFSSTRTVEPPASVGTTKPSSSVGGVKAVPYLNTPQAEGELRMAPLVILAQVYIIADTWDIPKLKDLAKAKYECMIQHCWNTPSFSESIQLIYENTREEDRAIKDVAIEIAQANVEELLERQEFRDVLRDTPEVALDVLQLNVLKLPQRLGRGLEVNARDLRCLECGDVVKCCRASVDCRFTPKDTEPSSPDAPTGTLQHAVDSTPKSNVYDFSTYPF